MLNNYMSGIRKYIDLVEQGFQPAFGRKGLAGTDRAYIPTDPKEHADLEKSRKYRSAEQYADAHNPYGPVSNVDPPHIHQKAEAEQKRLIDQWNHFKRLGML